MVLRDSAELGVMMAGSETLLTVVAIRLVALVAVGLIAKTVASDEPERAAACSPEVAAVNPQAMPVARTAADEIMRDMLLHD